MKLDVKVFNLSTSKAPPTQIASGLAACLPFMEYIRWIASVHWVEQAIPYMVSVGKATTPPLSSTLAASTAALLIDSWEKGDKISNNRWKGYAWNNKHTNLIFIGDFNNSSHSARACESSVSLHKSFSRAAMTRQHQIYTILLLDKLLHKNPVQHACTCNASPTNTVLI